jgi:hypothetical protein
MFLVGMSARGHFTMFPLIFFLVFPGTIIFCLIIDSTTGIPGHFA